MFFKQISETMEAVSGPFCMFTDNQQLENAIAALTPFFM
jgi:hypothetical protein